MSTRNGNKSWTSPRTIGATLLAAAVFLTACGSGGKAPSGPSSGSPSNTGSPPASSAPKQGGTLIFGVESIGGSSDPGVFTSFGNWQAIDSICEGLVHYDYSGPDAKAQPALAEYWQISPDGTTYTFTLRKDVKFHDGTDLTAEAVKLSWNRLLDENDPTRAPGTYAGSEIGGDNIKEINVLDTHEVELVLHAPDRAQLLRLANPNAVILSPDALDKHGKNIGQHLVCTGPFKMDELVDGQHITMSAFDGYWGGRPYLDKLILKAIGDEATIISALRAGEIDITNHAPITSLQQLEKDPNLKVEVSKPYITMFLNVNAKHKPFDDKRVRQALNYAIDRVAIRDGVFDGRISLPAGMIPPAEFGYNQEFEQQSTLNVEKAKQLLTEAGYPDGIDVTIDVVNNLFWPRLAETVQASAAKAGIRIKINVLDPGTWNAKLDQGEAQLSMQQRSAFVADPDNKLTPLLYSTSPVTSQTGTTLYPNYKELDEMLDGARQELNVAKAKEMYDELQQWLLDESPIVYLGYLPLATVSQKYVEGVNVDALGTYRTYPRTIWLNK